MNLYKRRALCWEQKSTKSTDRLRTTRHNRGFQQPHSTTVGTNIDHLVLLIFKIQEGTSEGVVVMVDTTEGTSRRLGHRHLVPGLKFFGDNNTAAILVVISQYVFEFSHRVTINRQVGTGLHRPLTGKITVDSDCEAVNTSDWSSVNASRCVVAVSLVNGDRSIGDVLGHREGANALGLLGQSNREDTGGSPHFVDGIL